MAYKHPTVTSVDARRREFITVPVALQAIVINSDEEILLMNSPRRNHGWQVVSGGMEAEESVLDGTLREIGEELGPDVRVRPLGVVHAQSFHYDEGVQYMLGVYYLCAYEGGNIVPGDDMAGSAVRWWSLAELAAQPELPLDASTKPWMLKRAVDLYRLWHPQADAPLQAEI